MLRSQPPHGKPFPPLFLGGEHEGVARATTEVILFPPGLKVLVGVEDLAPASCSHHISKADIPKG